MSIQIRNGISPELAARMAVIRDKRPVLEAMGKALVAITKHAFTDASLRPAPWAPLKPATLKRKKGKGGILRGPNAVMQRSIRVTEVTENSVTSGTDRPYAAIHQLGGHTGRNHAVLMPARPFFPVLDGHLTAVAATRIARVAEAKIKALLP